MSTVLILVSENNRGDKAERTSAFHIEASTFGHSSTGFGAGAATGFRAPNTLSVLDITWTLQEVLTTGQQVTYGTLRTVSASFLVPDCAVVNPCGYLNVPATASGVLSGHEVAGVGGVAFGFQPTGFINQLRFGFTRPALAGANVIPEPRTLGLLLAGGFRWLAWRSAPWAPR